MRNYKKSTTKRTPRAARSLPTADTRLVSVARATVVRGLETLEDCIKRVERDLKGRTYDTKLASHLAYLTEHATGVLRELRQLERHDRKRADEMSDAETYQLLIDAGWRPPSDWAPPEGVRV